MADHCMHLVRTDSFNLPQYTVTLNCHAQDCCMVMNVLDSVGFNFILSV